MRAGSWQRVGHGLYVPRSGSPDLAGTLAGWQLAMSATSAFTSLTAAAIRGWWVPDEIAHPVFVSVPETDPHPSRRGMFVIRHPQPFAWERVHGLRVVSPAETLLAAARDLSLIDLVILGDSALQSGDCTVDEIINVAQRFRWGAPRLRAVIPLLDGRSESAWESVLRVLHVVAGVEVEPQREITDGFGRFVARADLWVVGTRRLHEYDGAGHREQETHRRDLRREGRLVESGWQRVGFSKPQLLYDGASVIAGLDRLLGRAWDPRRLRAWNGLLEASLLRSAGRAAVLQRWRRAL